MSISKTDVELEVERVEGDDDDEQPSPEDVTDDLQFVDALKIGSYVGAPSGFGSYVGFAPNEGG